MKKTRKNVIFSNYYSFERFDETKEFLLEDKEEGEEVTDEEIFEQMRFEEETNWEDFEYEMKKFLNDSKNYFVLEGNIGRWDGIYRGGYIIRDFKDFLKALDDMDYIEIYDENGHLFISCSHHDGSCSYEVKELTDKGEEYLNLHYYDYREDYIPNLMKYNLFSRLPRFAEKVYGC